ncbi:hypothetical protein [Caballeronia sp. LZ019]|uniref:hypothetical protein n=1 Tax=Caballeronia sp. LZ019 TaxID=3038555 RepID=UPI0028672E5F|nr:hypothetical protein [Caballeronia sp. LZ019]MDR5811064.1 hypothetical protein [Caballeronia sp. LZ019]
MKSAIRLIAHASFSDHHCANVRNTVEARRFFSGESQAAVSMKPDLHALRARSFGLLKVFPMP